MAMVIVICLVAINRGCKLAVADPCERGTLSPAGSRTLIPLNALVCKRAQERCLFRAPREISVRRPLNPSTLPCAKRCHGVGTAKADVLLDLIGISSSSLGACIDRAINHLRHDPDVGTIL